MRELKFYSSEDYLDYDFDDSYCFFYLELKEYGEKAFPDPSLVDYEKKFKRIIADLYKIYDALILIPDEEILYGLIGQTRFLIRKSPKEL